MVNKVAAARAVMKGKMRQDGNLPIVAFVDTSESYSVRASNVSDDEIAKSIRQVWLKLLLRLSRPHRQSYIYQYILSILVV